MEISRAARLETTSSSAKVNTGQATLVNPLLSKFNNVLKTFFPWSFEFSSVCGTISNTAYSDFLAQ
jgi:hypothetical protein